MDTGFTPWMRVLNSVYLVLRHGFPRRAGLDASWRRHKSALIRHCERRATPPVTVEVERRTDLSETEFVRDYLNRGRPVIFSGEINRWPALAKWDLRYLRDHHAEREFPLIAAPGFDKQSDHTEISKPRIQAKMKVRDFFAACERGEKPYLRFCPAESHAEIQRDLNHEWLQRMRRCFFGASCQTFLGPAGTKTALHCETTAFFHMVLDGRKKWTLFPSHAFPLIDPETENHGYSFSKVDVEAPCIERYPGFVLLSRYRAELEKGDILFVPAWMWHAVENLTPTWAISYKFTHLRGFIKSPALAMIRIFFSRPSFLQTLYYSFFRTDIAQRQENPLTPKISVGRSKQRACEGAK